MTNHHKIEFDEITFKTKRGEIKTYPLMRIKIFGKLGIADVKPIMDAIREAVKKMDKDYISITNLRDLDINKTLQSMIFFGMEKFYNKMLSVENPAKYSFVLVDGEDRLQKTVSTLESINKNRGNISDPVYNYLFISNYEQMSELLGVLD